METEEIISGYCRQLDGSRIVTVELTDGKIDDIDCCYGSCIYQPACQIAQRIDELTDKL